MGAHQIADRRPEFDLGNGFVQQDETALLRLLQAIRGRIAGDQDGWDAFAVIGPQALDHGDAVLAVAQPIVADDEIRPARACRDAIQHFGSEVCMAVRDLQAEEPNPNQEGK